MHSYLQYNLGSIAYKWRLPLICNLQLKQLYKSSIVRFMRKTDNGRLIT